MIIDLEIAYFWIVYSIIVFFIFLSTKGKRKKSHRITLYLFSLYMLFVIKITLFPIVVGGVIVSDGLLIQPYPFATIIDSIRCRTFEVQIIGNIIMFIPFPVFMILLQKYQNKSCKKIFFEGLLLSCGIEGMQLIENLVSGTMLRKFDVDDIILNCMGVFIGIILCNKIIDIFKNKKIIKGLIN